MNESETRAALFVPLEELSEIIPEMRAGQIMAAVGELCVNSVNQPSPPATNNLPH